MTKRMLIECDNCGKVFEFKCTHRLKKDVEANLDWALTHVTLCPECRPAHLFPRYYQKHYDRRPGIGGTDYL